MKIILLTTQNINPTFCARQKCVSKAELEKLIAENKTNREIATILGISHSYVKQLRREYGLPNERIPFSRKEFTNLVKAEKTDREISQITGLSYQYTGILRRKLNLPAQTTAIPKSIIEPLVKEQKSNREIAETLGISEQWLKVLKRRYGLNRDYIRLNIEEIKQLILQGKSDKEISKQYNGGHLRAISDIRCNMGIKHTRKTDESIIRQIIELSNKGFSVNKIAKTIGKSLSWTSQLYTRLNLKQEKNKKFLSEIKELESQGKSIKEIADLFKKSVGWIYYMKGKKI